MKYYLAITLAFGAILGWNAFLITRDNKMFKSYYGNLTPKEQFCKQQAGWHPDCNVE
jgi:hypothetical protein